MFEKLNGSTLDRRSFLGLTAGAGASLALTPELLRALQRTDAVLQPAGQLIQRAIPSSGERLPMVGLSFSNHPGCADHAALKEVLKAFADGGGRVYDALHVNPTNESFHINAAHEVGIHDKVFWSTRGNPANAAPKAELVKPHVESLLARTKRPRIDLAMVPVASDAATIAAIREEKKAASLEGLAAPTSSSASRTSSRVHRERASSTSPE